MSCHPPFSQSLFILNNIVLHVCVQAIESITKLFCANKWSIKSNYQAGKKEARASAQFNMQ